MKGHMTARSSSSSKDSPPRSCHPKCEGMIYWRYKWSTNSGMIPCKDKATSSRMHCHFKSVPFIKHVLSQKEEYMSPRTKGKNQEWPLWPSLPGSQVGNTCFTSLQLWVVSYLFSEGEMLSTRGQSKSPTELCYCYYGALRSLYVQGLNRQRGESATL